MSQENVEIVKRLLEAYDQGGFAATGDFLHPDFEMSSPPEQPDSGTYRGAAALRYMQEWQSIFDSFRSGVEELIDAGDDVIVAVREHVKARGSDVELGKTYYAVCTVRDEKVLRLQWFSDRQEALDAVGQREQTST
jgi:ketosteroid isomerase-like protein